MAVLTCALLVPGRAPSQRALLVHPRTGPAPIILCTRYAMPGGYDSHCAVATSSSHPPPAPLRIAENPGI
eukprot:3752610-Rhodomonas_salina.2